MSDHTDVIAWSLKGDYFEYRLMVIDRFIIIGSELIPAGQDLFSYFLYEEGTVGDALDRAVGLTEDREQMGFAMRQWPMLRRLNGLIDPAGWLEPLNSAALGVVYTRTLEQGLLMGKAYPHE